MLAGEAGDLSRWGGWELQRGGVSVCVGWERMHRGTGKCGKGKKGPASFRVTVVWHMGKGGTADGRKEGAACTSSSLQGRAAGRHAGGAAPRMVEGEKSDIHLLQQSSQRGNSGSGVACVDDGL
eukprot:7973036-Prorocentrum_lima.AAC.1